MYIPWHLKKKKKRNQDKQNSFQQIILRSMALKLKKKRKFDSYFIPYTKKITSVLAINSFS